MSSEYPSHSSTNSTPINLKLSEQLKAKERDSRADFGIQKVELLNHLFAERESISGCSSNSRCNGIMGVPITFLDKYNPNQFEILGMAASAGYKKEIVGIEFLGQKDARPLINGKNTYARVFIRKKR